MTVGVGEWELQILDRQTGAPAGSVSGRIDGTIERGLEETGTASITIVSNCCDFQIEPRCHELRLTMAGVGQFRGPVATVASDIDPETGEHLTDVVAFDRSWWWDYRLFDDGIEGGLDASEVFRRLVDYANRDDSTGLTASIAPTARTVQSEIPAGECRPVAEHIGYLSQRDVDWTVVDDVLYAGAEDEPLAPLIILRAEDFEGENVRVQKSGALIASRIKAVGRDGNTAWYPDYEPGVQNCYGYAERTVYDGDIDETGDLERLAKATWERNQTPSLSVLSSGRSLKASTKLPLRNLIPGAEATIGTGSCIQPDPMEGRIIRVRVDIEQSHTARTLLDVAARSTYASAQPNF